MSLLFDQRSWKRRRKQSSLFQNILHYWLLTDPVKPGLFYKRICKWVTDTFLPNLQNTIHSKPLELGTWHFDKMFTTCQISCVTCQKSHVTCHISHVTCHVSHVACNMYFFCLQIGGSNRWRVCYQWSLPRLVSIGLTLWDPRGQFREPKKWMFYCLIPWPVWKK